MKRIVAWPLGLGLMALAGLGIPAAAQAPGAASDPQELVRKAEEAAAEKTRREAELRALEEAAAANDEARRKLEAEIATIKADRAALNTALIETAGRLRAAEERIRELEGRLLRLASSESAIRTSLDARRGVIIEVLAALQRMGRRPPPAVLARPEDILAAVRTSMLLGAVLPELRSETETLAADLGELVRLKNAIVADQDTLRGELQSLAADRNRLNALMAARQVQLAEAESNAAGQRERETELGSKARTLKELIEGLDREASSAKTAAEEARKAAEAQARESRERFASLAFRDPARLAPKLPFTEARGLLPRPVSGDQVRDFGVADGYGGTTRGISVVTRPRATVVSPSDGWVAYAGPFRSYGRLLIINAGGGYYLLLAGMETITVEVGQFVLAGEPVASMGETRTIAPATGAVETDDPVLYIEFRKDGASIDPAPWWAKSQSEKVRG